MKLNAVHHIAIIATDYEKALEFYVQKLGFTVIRDTGRPDRGDRKIDLQVNEATQIELFIKPDAPARVTNPEAAGLRHLAFTVRDIDEAVQALAEKGIQCEPVRMDENGGRFTFFRDPDDLPLELHE